MNEWGWALADTARRDFDSLDHHARDRIATKLSDVRCNSVYIGMVPTSN